MLLTGVLLAGTFAARPAAATLPNGTLYASTDTGVIYQVQSAAWVTWYPAPAGTGTVTSVGSGTGLTGGPITTSGNLALANTAVTPGVYGDADNVAQVTVDAQGRLTAVTEVPITGGGGVGDALKPPTVAELSSTFTASGTSTVVTMPAPTPGTTLIALVSSRSRGCNSITQTNVAWTQRYTASGNSQFLELWTGVVSAAPGTTATFAFTGANSQQCATFAMPGAPAYTTVTDRGNATTSGATFLAISASNCTDGAVVIPAFARNNPSSGALGGSDLYAGILGTGGALCAGIMKANTPWQAHMNVTSTSVAGFGAYLELS